MDAKNCISSTPFRSTASPSVGLASSTRNVWPHFPNSREPSKENAMADATSSFVYVTYIRTTPDRLWEALTTSEFMTKYWFGAHFETDWKMGSPWKMTYPDGRITDAGEIVEFDRPRRIVLKWKHELQPELAAE